LEAVFHQSDDAFIGGPDKFYILGRVYRDLELHCFIICNQDSGVTVSKTSFMPPGVWQQDEDHRRSGSLTGAPILFDS
jgi:hypothetical protein